MPAAITLCALLLILSVVPVVNRVAIPALLVVLCVVIPLRLWQAIGDLGRTP